MTYRFILLLQLLLLSLSVSAQEALTSQSASADSLPPARLRIGRRGIIVLERDSLTRAFEPFNGLPANGTLYAEAINRYARKLPRSVRIYSMLIPTAAAFYATPQCEARTRHQPEAISHIYSRLDSAVAPVSVYDTLFSHRHRPIYLRTDHHWSPQAAYYAAARFAEVAGVPFLSLAAYDTCVVHRFVGTMARFSQLPSVKAAPEEFVYYVPRDTAYTVSYVKYRMSSDYRTVLGERPPVVEPFFVHYPHGSILAYSTFMGGDARTVTISTCVNNGRRLMLVKDSYGNALPAYLFASFERIVVVDFRYYRKNLPAFIAEQGITDLLFVNNLGHAYTPSTARHFYRLFSAPQP